MNHRHLERARQLQAAARRRSEICRWHEAMRHIMTVKPRSDEERVAQHQAIELLHLARPG